MSLHFSMEVLKKMDSNFKGTGKIKTFNIVNKLAYNNAENFSYKNEKFNWTKKQVDDFVEGYFLKPKGNFNYDSALEFFKHLEDIEAHRNKAQLGLNLIISLDNKLPFETNKKIINDLCNHLFLEQNIPVDVVFHKKGDNNHCHLLAPLRTVDSKTGRLIKDKNKVRSSNNPHFNSVRLRSFYADLVNKERAKLGIEERISYKTNQQKIKEALAKDDLAKAMEKSYKTQNKKEFRDWGEFHRRRKAYQTYKANKAKAREEAEKLKADLERIKQLNAEINDGIKLKKEILEAGQEIANEYSRTQRILNKALNSRAILEQQRKQNYKPTY